MISIQYPDGSQLTSTALSENEIETVFQYTACQLLGILADPKEVTFALTNGSIVAIPSQPNLPNNFWLLYQGQFLEGNGVPPNTFITLIDDGKVYLSNNATVTGNFDLTVTDRDAFAKVRIGWQKQGQPGPDINLDTAFIRCIPQDSPYSRLRDNRFTEDGVYKDVFTRAWRGEWTFYGPNSLNRCKFVLSGLLKLALADNILSQNNLYINPDIEEPSRVPERFQGQWWPRVDMIIDFNEQITEILSIGGGGYVKSVEILIYNETGKVRDFTVTAP